MLWYRLTDFIRSPLGRVLIFSVAVVGVVVLIGQQEQEGGIEAETAKGLTPLPVNRLWLDEAEPLSGSGVSESPEFVMTEPNPGYRSFEAVSVSDSDPVRSQVKPASPPHTLGNPIFPMGAPIRSERPHMMNHEQAVEPRIEEDGPGLAIEKGAILYCRLTAPVSSDQAMSPIQAELTRPFIRRGRVILPTSSRLFGRLSDRTDSSQLLFQLKWEVEMASGDWHSIWGHARRTDHDAQSQAYSAGDGQIGLPGESKKWIVGRNNHWRDILRTVLCVNERGFLEWSKMHQRGLHLIPDQVVNGRLPHESLFSLANGQREDSSRCFLPTGRRFHLCIEDANKLRE